MNARFSLAPAGRRLGALAGLLFLSALIVGCQPGEKGTDQNASDKAAATSGQSAGAADQGPSARAVLDAMVKAYRDAKTYEDRGRLVMSGQVNGQPLEGTSDYRITFERPDQIHLKVVGGEIVCDGKEFQIEAQSAYGQVLRRPAPQLIDLRSLLGEPLTAAAMGGSQAAQLSWAPIPALLLLSDDPLKTLLDGASEPVLLEPKEIADYPCHRVEIARTDGKAVFWIDQKRFVLRRLELPLDGWKRSMGIDPGADVSLTAEFASASLDTKIEPSYFRLEMPPGGQLVDSLTPTGPGFPSPDFFFTALDGKSVTKRALVGKVVVINAWGLLCPPCHRLLPELDKVREQFQANDKVSMLTVNVDSPDTPSADLEKLFAELKVRLPIYRDPRRLLGKAFGVEGTPTTFLIGPDGRIQDYVEGARPDIQADLAKKIDQLLLGKDVCTGEVLRFKAMKEHYGRVLDRMIQRDLFNVETIAKEVPEPGVADRSDPKVMKLSKLWESKDAASPGNVLVLDQPDGSTRILVADGGRAVIELDAQGKPVATHPLALPESELVWTLRTAVGADGKRYFAGTSRGMQQVHLFDASWNHLLSFPPEAGDNPHAGVADVALADLDGDGKLDVAVGYLGLVGVKCVSLEGRVAWSQRGVSNVLGMAVGPPDKDRQRPLYCTNDRSALATLGREGAIVGNINLEDNKLFYAVAASSELPRPGMASLCGLSAPQVGQNLAMGIDPDGNVLWSYQLPPGVAATPVERAVSGRLTADETTQWVLVGTDGSLHVVGPNGRALDHFALGTPVHGLAITRLAGGPAFIVATQDGVTAWSVEWPVVSEE